MSKQLQTPRKLLSAVIALLMICSILAVPCSAAETPNIRTITEGKSKITFTYIGKRIRLKGGDGNLPFSLALATAKDISTRNIAIAAGTYYNIFEFAYWEPIRSGKYNTIEWDGDTLAFTRNVKGQITKVVDKYDGYTRTYRFKYNERGDLLSVIGLDSLGDPTNGSVWFSYENNGRLKACSVQNGAGPDEYKFSCDTKGRIAYGTCVEQHGIWHDTLIYAYNNQDQLVKCSLRGTLENSTKNIVTDYSYANGMLSQITSKETDYDAESKRRETYRPDTVFIWY